MHTDKTRSLLHPRRVSRPLDKDDRACGPYHARAGERVPAEADAIPVLDIAPLIFEGLEVSHGEERRGAAVSGWVGERRGVVGVSAYGRNRSRTMYEMTGHGGGHLEPAQALSRLRPWSHRRARRPGAGRRASVHKLVLRDRPGRAFFLLSHRQLYQTNTT